MRSLPLLARAARGAPATQQAQMADYTEPLPFVVQLPPADEGAGGGASALPGTNIYAYRLGGALAMQHGEVVIRESALGPLIGTTQCKKRELDALFKAKGGSDTFRAWHGVQDTTIQMVTDTGVRQMIMAAGDKGGETAAARCARWETALRPRLEEEKRGSTDSGELDLWEETSASGSSGGGSSVGGSSSSSSGGAGGGGGGGSCVRGSSISSISSSSSSSSISAHGGSTHVPYFRIKGPQGGLCKTFPLSIRSPGTARFDAVRYDGSLQ